MSTHLTLVVDNTERVSAAAPPARPASRQPRVTSVQHLTTAPSAGRLSADIGDAEPAAPHWVHRVWQPRRPASVSRRALFSRSAVFSGRGSFSRHPSFRGLRAQLHDDRGAITAEYAVVIIAGIAFAGLLVAIIRSDEIRQTLVNLVQNALGSAG